MSILKERVKNKMKIWNKLVAKIGNENKWQQTKKVDKQIGVKNFK